MENEDEIKVEGKKVSAPLAMLDRATIFIFGVALFAMAFGVWMHPEYVDNLIGDREYAKGDNYMRLFWNRPVGIIYGWLGLVMFWGTFKKNR